MIESTAWHAVAHKEKLSRAARTALDCETMIYWLMKYVLIGPLVKAIFRPWVVGRDNVPTSGGAIMASNHLSFADSIFLPLVIDRRM